MSADYLREEIMKLYDIPEDLREKWRQLDVGRCPYCGSLMADGRDHGRMYEDGPIECVPPPTSGVVTYDADFPGWPRPAPWTPLRNPFRWRPAPPSDIPSACYVSEYGFTVHVKGACECPR